MLRPLHLPLTCPGGPWLDLYLAGIPPSLLESRVPLFGWFYRRHSIANSIESVVSRRAGRGEHGNTETFGILP